MFGLVFFVFFGIGVLVKICKVSLCLVGCASGCLVAMRLVTGRLVSFVPLRLLK